MNKPRYSKMSLGRHKKRCSICQHEQCKAIEDEYISWASPARIAERYGVSQDAIYRHVSAFGLSEKRGKNIRFALAKIIERVDDVTEITPAAVVSAIQAYAKINRMGQWVERVEGTNMNDLFDNMTTQELEEYAKNGILPGWFPSVVGANLTDSEE